MNFGIEHIDDYTQDLPWMLRALLQLEKEFAHEQWTFDKPIYPKTAFHEIVKELQPKLDALIQESGASYARQLLYKIDISEQQVAKANFLAVDSEFSEVLSKLILKRCLQKVLIRDYYKTCEKDTLGKALGK